MAPLQLMTTGTFLLSALGVAMYRTHLVSALLCIEGMLLTLFINLITMTQNMELTTMICSPMTILTFSACEACTGLALLVASTRTHASDHLKNLNLLQC
uniref:NADH-ubiquinone oxidoreductase chain 4L n=1 Tax=Aeluroscalabotes felinus TaxID=96749 RepID=A0A1Y1CF52_AELFE|nr:NADH dehydrogenase subunit 4L [Aeluroscalabotes felinus]BAX77931.1 NADH dehydrogenase subunit 4L [Aeluroscalabotes felinus]